MDTVTISVELPREAFSALRQDPQNFVRAMRLAAAISGTKSNWSLDPKRLKLPGFREWNF